VRADGLEPILGGHGVKRRRSEDGCKRVALPDCSLMLGWMIMNLVHVIVDVLVHYPTVPCIPLIINGRVIDKPEQRRAMLGQRIIRGQHSTLVMVRAWIWVACSAGE
jgi:hypothetical protein